MNWQLVFHALYVTFTFLLPVLSFTQAYKGFENFAVTIGAMLVYSGSFIFNWNNRDDIVNFERKNRDKRRAVLEEGTPIWQRNLRGIVFALILGIAYAYAYNMLPRKTFTIETIKEVEILREHPAPSGNTYEGLTFEDALNIDNRVHVPITDSSKPLLTEDVTVTVNGKDLEWGYYSVSSEEISDMPKKLTIFFDISQSLEGENLIAAKTAVIEAMKTLDQEDDRVRLILFGKDVHFGNWIKPVEAMDQINAIMDEDLEGYTATGPAILAYLAANDPGDFSIMVTDGVPTQGPRLSTIDTSLFEVLMTVIAIETEDFLDKKGDETLSDFSNSSDLISYFGTDPNGLQEAVINATQPIKKQELVVWFLPEETPSSFEVKIGDKIYPITVK